MQQQIHTSSCSFVYSQQAEASESFPRNSSSSNSSDRGFAFEIHWLLDVVQDFAFDINCCMLSTSKYPLCSYWLCIMFAEGSYTIHAARSMRWNISVHCCIQHPSTFSCVPTCLQRWETAQVRTYMLHGSSTEHKGQVTAYLRGRTPSPRDSCHSINRPFYFFRCIFPKKGKQLVMF